MAYKYRIEAEKRLKEKDWAQYYQYWEQKNFPTEIIQDLVKKAFLEGASANLKLAFDSRYCITRYGIVELDRRQPWEDVPELDMPCAKASEEKPGLYFIGMIGITPDDKKYYMVKVGDGSKGIAKRVNTYATYNPMIYHNNCCLPREEYDSSCGESNCHWYLAERAYARGQGSHEWFYVDEETYYELCETFADKEMFRAIAEGRD